MSSISSLLGTALALFSLVSNVDVLNNGLARTPPMGWMSWGYYMCANKCDKNPHKCLDENLIMNVADAFYKLGYQEAGYQYIIIDDCWSEGHRDHNGRLVPNRDRFPRGIKFLADYVHSRGLKLGMYGNIGMTTCMGYPGSQNYIDIDTQQLADWDVDYIKVDGCFVSTGYLYRAYIQYKEALDRAKRPMVFGCSWPFYSEFIHNKTFDLGLVAPVCNLWRNFHDVNLTWGMVKYIIEWFASQYYKMSQHHGPGMWNDPDMLILGTNTLTKSQSRVQMAVYSLMSAPLLISCPMNMITEYEKNLLQNLDLIAINQDPLGIMAKPYMKTTNLIIYVKKQHPVKGNTFYTYSFGIVNLGKNKEYYHIVPGDYGPNSTSSYAVLDVFKSEFMDNVTINSVISGWVPAEDAIVYTLYPL